MHLQQLILQYHCSALSNFTQVVGFHFSFLEVFCYSAFAYRTSSFLKFCFLQSICKGTLMLPSNICAEVFQDRAKKENP